MFVNRHISVISCTDGIVEKNCETVRILGRYEAKIDAAGADVDKPKTPSENHQDPENESLSQSSIRAAQTIPVPPMTELLS